MLDRGDASVLAAPQAGFHDELSRLPLPRSKFPAHNSGDFAAEAAEADATELRHALRESGRPAAEQKELFKNYEKERTKLTDFRNRLQHWNPNPTVEWINGVFVTNEPPPRPEPEDLDAPALADVPGEFVDYLQGSMTWFNLQTNDARSHWEALLRRPPGERHYRSTWAAYMLGKSWATDDPDKAAGYFQQVRALKQSGFADRIGLAATSLGEEARLNLRQRKFEEAFNLYLMQLAAGADSAADSLAFTCRDALNLGQDSLPALAANPSIRRVMSAFLASESYSFEDCIDTNRVSWLEAAAAADVQDTDSMEQLALIAYQAEQWNVARQWIQRAPQTPTAQWLHAKLLLRDGKREPALKILYRIVDSFPTQLERDSKEKPTGLGDDLYLPGGTFTTPTDTAHSQILAEIGALQLARRQYTESLDAFVQSGFWVDAAYVAERVVTIAELKNYVDQYWPAVVKTNSPDGADAGYSFDARENIRWLLGRRLTRAGEFDAARAYYPEGVLSNFDAMIANLDAAQKAESSASDRAAAYIAASGIFYTHGMDLLGTEVQPDWRLWTGRYNNFFDNRQETNSSLTTASADEIARNQDGVDPELRYHYEYQAAGLAWEAAKLMPDNSVEKARLLCRAGSWIQGRDPAQADYFYKALVRHGRKTAIGALADRMRWFPALDADGNPVPWTPAAPVETNAPPDKLGYCYVLNRGNTLQDVADTVRQQHNIETTAAQLRQANPEININRLKAGLLVLVPTP